MKYIMSKVVNKLVFLLCEVIICGCTTGKYQRGGSSSDSTYIFSHTPANAIYHWKTSFKPNKFERNFISQHQIKRLYIRMFDVGTDNLYNGEGTQPVPIATTMFKDSLKSLEGMDVVPVVYITVEALRLNMPMCDKILKRVDDMCRAQKIRYREVQFDCDWTKETKPLFFALCQEAKESLHKSKKGLSATIRLHQLRDTLPDIDYGVLMLYNTESLINSKVKNSILNSEIVEEYMRHAQSDKHLDFAYPTYEWTLWFMDGEFKGILPISQDLPKAGILRHEKSDFEEILKAKRNIKSELIDISYSSANIIYHLDSANLSKYSIDEIENIFSH